MDDEQQDTARQEALATAIRDAMDWVEDDGEPRLLTDWIVIAKFATTGAATTMATHTSDNMDIVTRLGLAHYDRLTAERRAFEDD